MSLIYGIGGGYFPLIIRIFITVYAVVVIVKAYQDLGYMLDRKISYNEHPLKTILHGMAFGGLAVIILVSGLLILVLWNIFPDTIFFN